MSEYYGAPNDFRNYLMHYGVKGMKWGRRKKPTDYEIGKVRPSRLPLGKKNDQSDSYDPRDKAGINKVGKDRYDKTVSGYDPRDRAGAGSQKTIKNRTGKQDINYTREKSDSRDKGRIGKSQQHVSSIQRFVGSNRNAIRQILTSEANRQTISSAENKKQKRRRPLINNRKQHH